MRLQTVFVVCIRPLADRDSGARALTYEGHFGDIQARNILFYQGTEHGSAQASQNPLSLRLLQGLLTSPILAQGSLYFFGLNTARSGNGNENWH